MTVWFKRLLVVAAILVAVLVLLVTIGPREKVVARFEFDPMVIGTDVDAYLAEREAPFPDITPGTEKRVVWAGEVGEKTPISVLYVHGFSATSEEIRPVPDMLAAALGANLHFTRLRGHGRSGDAMGSVLPEDWIADTAEALAVARVIGERVIIVATSTGGTLAAIAAVNDEARRGVIGIAFVSPNFGINMRGDRALTWPWIRQWGPLFAGRVRSFRPLNEDHAKFWTTAYPIDAVFSMAALVAHAEKQDFGEADTPALFLFSESDAVVSASATRAIAERWSGPVTLSPFDLPPGNDPYSHVIAGRIVSPGATDAVAQILVDWATGL